MNNELKQNITVTPLQLRVLKAIRYGGVNTRTGLCTYLGISRATVTPLVIDMIAKGMLITQGVVVNRQVKGRNACVLELNPSYRLVFGIAVESGFVHILLSTMGGDCVSKRTVEFSQGSYHDLLSLIVKLIEEQVRNNLLTPEKILGIGVAVSEAAQEIIEGTDKLARIKKDLSFALDYRITSRSLCTALLNAHCIFDETKTIMGTVALLRISRERTFDYMVDGIVNRPKARRRPFFADVEIESPNAPEQIADAINKYDIAVSPTKIFIMGELGSEYTIQDINRILEDKYKQKLKAEMYFIELAELGKAGCAIAINDVFQII